MEDFETRSVISRDTKELKRHRRRPQDKIIFILCAMFGLFVIIRSIVTQNTTFTIIGIAFVVLILLVIVRDEVVSRQMWTKIGESSGTEELEMIVSFLEDNIKICDPQSGGIMYVSYDTICRFVETKNMYILFTKAHQCVVVNKMSLIQEQKNEDFIRFIKEKCKNVKWKK